jgi:hypothetical protein
MIRMLPSFDLRLKEDFARFGKDFDALATDLPEADMIEGAGPLDRRVTGTPMDTDDTRTQCYFSVMRFRDRAQLGVAYTHIDARNRPGISCHLRIDRRPTNRVFLYWEDSPPRKDTV